MTTFAFDINTNAVTFLKDQAAQDAWDQAQDGYIITEWKDLYDMTGFQLVTLHNVIASELNKARPAGEQIADVKRFATKGAAEDRIKRLIADLFEVRGGAAQFKKASAPKKPAAPKASGPRRGTGINLQPKEPIRPCREGTKQATLVDMLSRPQGATMEELITALSGGNKPWQEVTVKSGLNWDMNKIKGYGIRTTKRGDTDCYHLVMPEGMEAPLPHTPKKG